MKKGYAEKVLVILVLSVGAIVLMTPFFWMVFSSFKPEAEIMAMQPTLLPKEFTMKNYEELFSRIDFLKYIKNTLIIVAYAFAGLLLNAMAGYGFAKFDFKNKEKYFYVVLATMMVPAQVILIPVYLIVLGLQLGNTFAGMSLPVMISGYSIFMFRQFMSTVPNEIIESARIDGAREFRIFWQLALPLVKSAVAVQAIMTFMGAWNCFLFPLIVATDENHYPIAVALSILKDTGGSGEGNYGFQMAAATVVVLPVVLIVVFFQRSIKEGVVMSGIKG